MLSAVPLARLRAQVSRNPAAILSAAADQAQARRYTSLGGSAAATGAAPASSTVHARARIANASARHTAVVGGIKNASIRNYTSHSQLPSEHQMIYEMCRKFAGMLPMYLRAPYRLQYTFLISQPYCFSRRRAGAKCWRMGPKSCFSNRGC